MAHQSHIQSEKYRQWVKAGLGLCYLKEGLAPFCDVVTRQQHNDILDNIKRTNNVPSVLCGTCTLKTLQPDHVKLGNKQCPLRQINCNCCYTAGKNPCPNNVCGAIYDSIITYHASTPPAPNWKNTQMQQWIADPWSIAKCFINAPGYEQKASAADTDCTGLLHVIINNKYIHNHVSCNMTVPNIFSKVRQYRNEIFHSSTMELDSPKTNSYIDDMIAVLQDRKELIHRQDAQEAVKKLQDLKQEDFVITTEDVEKVLGDIREEMGLIKITMEATKDDCEDLKLKVVTLESLISDLNEVIKNLKDDSSKKQTDFDTLKEDLREKLIKEYTENLLQVSAMPCQPESLCNFKDVYVNPRMTKTPKDKYGREFGSMTMSDILLKDNKPLKAIYIIGEAGSGKSSFCKSLVHCWCMTHTDVKPLDSQQAEENTENYADSFKVMEKFNFLFFLPLRHFTDRVTIKDMLEEEYEHPVLKELLERESETCLIMLDGLDEWTHTTKCPPKRAKFRNYTVLTTSRPWTIGSLGIDDNEMQQSIYIEGFGKQSRKNMIAKTIKILSDEFPENKRAKDNYGPRRCKRVLAKEPLYSLTHTAMMLQQLICLWFEDRLIATSKCHLYTCMLDLYFVWNKQKEPDMLEEMLDKSHGIELPKLLNKTDECKNHSFIIQYVSRLAYETLIKNPKETSLTFDSSMFQQLGIPNNIKTCCLKLGILSEEKGPSLSASRRRKTHISFIHKSVQEYLAAVYIVLNLNTEQKSSLDTENSDLSDYLSQMIHAQTVDEVLEQENVLIMMCGLEPRLAKSFSKFVFDILARDTRVLTYRTTIDFAFKDSSCLRNIQTLILNCIDETKSSNNSDQFRFDLGDVDINWNQSLGRCFTSVDEQNITLDSVISFHVHPYLNPKDYDRKTLEIITKFKKLEAMNINFAFDAELYSQICDCIEANASTLKCLSVRNHNQACFNVQRSPFQHFADMTHLVALQVDNVTVTHVDFTLLCTFLSGTGLLQQISIGISCDCKEQHDVDLSKHKQLQYLKHNDRVIVKNAEFTNLKVIDCRTLVCVNCIKVLNLLSVSMKVEKITLTSISSSKIENKVIGTDASSVHATTIKCLSKLLPTLKQLRKLSFNHFILTDTIINCPSELKMIKCIDISGGRMGLTTWKKFAESVANISHPVKVKAWCMCITQDWEVYDPKITEGKKGITAIRYIRDRESLFHVSLYFVKYSIEFSTKK